MDTHDNLTTMVHALDKRLTETAAWARAGIDHNAGNLQRVIDGLKETRDQLYNATNGKPGLISLVNTWHYETIPSLRKEQADLEAALKVRCEALDKRLTWVLRLMGSAIVTLVVSLILVIVKK